MLNQRYRHKGRVRDVGRVHLQLRWLCVGWLSLLARSSNADKREDAKRSFWGYASELANDLLPLFLHSPAACALPLCR